MRQLFGKIRNFLVTLIIYLLPLYQKALVWRLRRKKRINVVFYAMSLSQWRYQHLYDMLLMHPKFNPTIVICPAITYPKAQQLNDIKLLSKYFDDKGIQYVVAQNIDGNILDVQNVLAPDMLFYPQPYHGYYPEQLAYAKFWNRLLCYYPYAFWMGKDDWSYNLRFHNIAWKLFYPTNMHLRDAQIYSSVRGRNMKIVGYPTADDFLSDNYVDIWRGQVVRKKRVIWAPHFTIISNDFTKQSTFLYVAEYMMELASTYCNQIQFVFKPHPRLYSELCKHPDWGEEKTRQYYEQWETMENTQVETGEFVDLFMTSDAMIHDCGSFAVEYHYTENPVMYIAQNFEEQVAEKNDFGKLAMKLHYVGKCKEDIVEFIENVVLRGEDPMKPQRQQFKREYLLPPNGKTVAENTMDVFLKAFC